MKGEKKYKEGTVLTNGKTFILLRWRRDANWTQQNNYGRKWCEYWGCKSWPKQEGRSGYVGDLLVFSNPGEIPGLWLQPGQQISETFIEFDKKNLKEDIGDYFFNQQ